MAVHTLHRLHGRVGNDGGLNGICDIVVTGLAEGVSAAVHEPLRRTVVAAAATLAKRWVDRTVGNERHAAGSVGVVAAAAAGGRHLRPEVQPSKF